MLFNSFHFLVFFIIVTSIYFMLPHKLRWMHLLICSCYFYMAFVPVYILILGFTIIIDYFAGIWIENAEGRKRKLYLSLSLIANISVLAFFKYYNFLNTNLTHLLHGGGYANPIPYLSILLPIGLSFHTFQAMSYTIEVYRGHQKAERHFGIYSLYVMFYPQLVAGPIERPQNLLHQFREKYNFDYDRVTSGVRLIAWGLFKKVIIADRLSYVVDHVFKQPEQFNSLSLIIGAIFFAFQIFCDFSGYSDIAIGAARVMGFKLMKNFNAPYHSSTVAEFWKRWHISLSTWFKDYLYISLGGNRVSIPRWYLNLFIVFLISGLWHGANWTFIIWGAIHGFYMVFALITQQKRKTISRKLGLERFKLLSVISTFVLVTLAWVFFRADNVHVAVTYISHLFSGIPDLFHKITHHQTVYETLGVRKPELIACFFLILFLETIHLLHKRYNLEQTFRSQKNWVRWSVYYGYIIILIIFGIFEKKQFIYFQF
jgi:alginate O-acetyltransferase complex protein AlgI